jgi:preprotein translocase subunit YajC
MEQLTQFAPFLMFVVIILYDQTTTEKKKQKNEKNLKALKVGDRIITKSGLHGKSEPDTTVVIETMSEN